MSNNSTAKQIAETYEVIKNRNKGRPFTLIIRSPGGAAPVQIYEAQPVKRGIKLTGK